MDAAAARACTAVIKEEHNIADEMSRDVREQLEAEEAAARNDAPGLTAPAPPEAAA